MGGGGGGFLFRGLGILADVWESLGDPSTLTSRDAMSKKLRIHPEHVRTPDA